MNKTPLLIIFALILAPAIYAGNFDDFKNTYDYSYSGEDISLRQVLVKNCEAPCSSLLVEAEFFQPFGNYEYSFLLDGKIYVEKRYSFGDEETVDAVFYPEFSTLNPILYINIRKDNRLVFGKQVKMDISNMTFVKPQISVKGDSVSDGKLLITIDSDLDNVSKIKGYLKSRTQEYAAFANASENASSFTLEFLPDEDSEFTLYKVIFENYTILQDYTTQFYNLTSVRIENDSLIAKNLMLSIYNPYKKTINLVLFSENDKFIDNTTTDCDTANFSLQKINDSMAFGQYKLIYYFNETQKTYFTYPYSYLDIGVALNFTDNLSINESGVKTRVRSVMRAINGFIRQDEKEKHDDENKNITIIPDAANFTKQHSDENKGKSIFGEVTIYMIKRVKSAMQFIISVFH